MPFINEIFVMDDIFAFEEQAAKKYHIPIPNVSHWDSSSAFQRQMSRALVLPEPSLPWNYYYTYSISAENRQQVLQNLGVPSDCLATVMGLLLQSSTIAIVNMINLLVHHHQKRLCILQPSYFSVASCCSMFSLNYGIEQISFAQGHPQIPLDRILAGGYDCIWITSPIFCTGYYPDETHIRDIAQLRAAGMTVIFDESLALPGKELIRSFPVDHKLFAIYSPHKAISINGLKFAVIVCEKRYEDFWSSGWMCSQGRLVDQIGMQCSTTSPQIIWIVAILCINSTSNGRKKQWSALSNDSRLLSCSPIQRDIMSVFLLI